MTVRCRPFPFLLLPMLAACASYRAVPVDPQAMRQAWQARRLDDPQLLATLRQRFPAADHRAAGSWDEARLLQAALLLNPDLQEARAGLAEAAAATVTARALPNPTVGLALEHYNQAQADASPWLWGISTDILVDTAVRRRLREHAAEAGVRAARLAYAEKVWKVRMSLRDALATRLVAARQRGLARQAVDVAQDLLEAARQRQALGEDSMTTVLQASQALAQASADAADAARQEAAAQADLARAVGVPATALQGVRLDWPDFDQPSLPDAATLDRLRDAALLARPDLEQALVAYQQREIELHQQVRAQYPQLSLGPGYTYDHGIRKLTFGASASLPVFDHNRGPIAEARARREAAAAHVRSVQADIDSQIAGALARLQAALPALAAARTGAAAAVRQREQAERAFELGAIDRTDLLSARLAALSAVRARLSALAQAWQARAALEDALHAPLDRDEADMPTQGDPR